MIIGIQQLDHKITYNYQVDNRLSYESCGYITNLGSVSNNISGFMKYKLIDRCNNGLVERIVLTNHQLCLGSPKTFEFGIFPLYSRKLNDPDDPTFFLEEGLNSSIYISYVNYIKSVINDKPTVASVSIQKCFVDRVIELLEVAINHYNIPHDVVNYCQNNINYLNTLSKKYNEILYQVGIHSTTAMISLIDFLCDPNNFEVGDLTNMVDRRLTSVMPDIDNYNTFEQIDVCNNRTLNQFILEVLFNKNMSLENGINLTHYLHRNISMLNSNKILKYDGLFRLDSPDIEFSFPPNYRLAFNVLISYLQNNNYSPCVVVISKSLGLEILDRSINNTNITPPPMTDSLNTTICILNDLNINNIKIMITNEEDVYITYNDNTGFHKIYIDLVLWSLVGFSSVDNNRLF